MTPRPKVIGDMTAVKVLQKEIARIEKLRIHRTEPRWSVIERALDALEKRGRRGGR